MPHLTMTWAQDHDYNHTQICATIRRSLQAKLARPLPHSHNPSVGQTYFFVHALAPNSIQGLPGHPSRSIDTFFITFALLKLPFRQFIS
jgi:hypothetical protein